MRSKMLVNMAQIAVIAAIGTVQLQQALPFLGKVAQRTVAPLERIVLLGSKPSYPGSALPAAHPSVPVAVCDRVVHVRTAVMHVEAPRVEVETVVDQIPARIVVPRRALRVRVPDAQAIAEMVRMEMRQADFEREMARAQREVNAAMERAQRAQRVVTF